MKRHQRTPPCFPAAPPGRACHPVVQARILGCTHEKSCQGGDWTQGHLGPRNSGAGGGGVKGAIGGRLGPQAAGWESGMDDAVTLSPQRPSWPPSAQGCSLLPRRGPPPMARGSPVYSYVVVSVPPGLGRTWKAGGRAGKWLSRPGPTSILRKGCPGQGCAEDSEAQPGGLGGSVSQDLRRRAETRARGSRGLGSP